MFLSHPLANTCKAERPQYEIQKYTLVGYGRAVALTPSVFFCNAATWILCTNFTEWWKTSVNMATSHEEEYLKVHQNYKNKLAAVL